jgi:hypothetical protein
MKSYLNLTRRGAGLEEPFRARGRRHSGARGVSGNDIVIGPRKISDIHSLLVTCDLAPDGKALIIVDIVDEHSGRISPRSICSLTTRQASRPQS